MLWVYSALHMYFETRTNQALGIIFPHSTDSTIKKKIIMWLCIKKAIQQKSLTKKEGLYSEKQARGQRKVWSWRDSTVHSHNATCHKARFMNWQVEAINKRPYEIRRLCKQVTKHSLLCWHQNWSLGPLHCFVKGNANSQSQSSDLNLSERQNIRILMCEADGDYLRRLSTVIAGKGGYWPMRWICIQPVNVYLFVYLTFMSQKRIFKCETFFKKNPITFISVYSSQLTVNTKSLEKSCKKT